MGDADYQLAVAALRRVDVVLVTEWMGDDVQVAAMRSIFAGTGAGTGGGGGAGAGGVMSSTSASGPGTASASGPGTGSLTVGHQLKGDRSVQQRLGAALASDAAAVERVLRDINALDLRLWAYAQDLVRSRWSRLSTGLAPTTATSSIPAVSTSAGIGISSAASAALTSVALAAAAAAATASISATAPAPGAISQSARQCGSGSLPPRLVKDVGLFRPPGHKGPLDSLDVLKVR